MTGIGRALMIAGVALALLGGVLFVAGRLGISRLPGDIVIRRDNVTIYLPIVSALVLSVVLTVLLNLFVGRR